MFIRKSPGIGQVSDPAVPWSKLLPIVSLLDVTMSINIF